ncbi:hypothetical protein LAZ67_X000562 [Cordylochernes scorpioides]|uniref:Uncharacterized protein n=1 Tax=Cordylochernes scorpioides TaxID=51811 RepID=A0ABY6LS47_9ARAC|nr:hypothetical protein LAZ67_X000562 [Cordylochernes scorpioides]
MTLDASSQRISSLLFLEIMNSEYLETLERGHRLLRDHMQLIINWTANYWLERFHIMTEALEQGLGYYHALLGVFHVEWMKSIQFAPLPNSTAEDHLDGIAKIIGRENIHSIGKINGNAIISVAGIEQAELLINTGFKVKEKTVYPSPLFIVPKKYILSGVLLFIPDDEIKRALLPFGWVLSVRPLPFPTNSPLYKHLSSLRREIVFKKNDEATVLFPTWQIRKEQVTRPFPDALTPTPQPQALKQPPTESSVPTSRQYKTSLKKGLPATNPNRHPRSIPPGGATAILPNSDSETDAESENYEEKISSRCSTWSMDSTQLQKELRECKERENPEVEKIIATTYRKAGISRATKVQQQLELHPDLEIKIFRYLEKQEEYKSKTFQYLKSHDKHDAEKAFKDDCISRSQSGKWHKAFKEGREEVADEPRSGRPTTARTDEDVDRVLEVLRTDRRLSIQQIADTLHMSTFVVHGIVTEDLQMRKVCAKLVPKVLTQDQKELRVLRCQELLDLIQNEPDFLNSVVTGDES